MDLSEKVYKLVSQIPKGRITTYKIIAQKLGIKNYRLIGQILKKNPQPIKIPCHRVIKSNGLIGGYQKGSNKKRQLLKKEGIVVKNDKVKNFKTLLKYF